MLIMFEGDNYYSAMLQNFNVMLENKVSQDL